MRRALADLVTGAAGEVMNRKSAAVVVAPALVLAFTLAPPAARADDDDFVAFLNSVTSVTFRNGNVEITAAAPPIFEVHKRPGTGQVAVEIVNGVFLGVPPEQVVNQGPVTYLKTEESGAGVTSVARVVIGLSREVDVDLADSGNTLVVKFSGAPVVADPAPAPAPATPVIPLHDAALDNPDPFPDAEAPFEPPEAPAPQARHALPGPASAASKRAAALTRRAMIEYDGGELDRALADAKKAYEALPAPGLLYNLGLCHRALHHWGEAAASFHAYLRELPDAPDRTAVEALIEQMNAVGPRRESPTRDPKLSLNPLAALPDDPQQSTPSGPPEPRVRAVSASGPASAASKRAAALNRRATIEYDGGEFDRALADWKKAYESQPATDLLYNLGLCHRALHHWDEATFSFQAYLRELPDAPDREAVEALLQQTDEEKAVALGAQTALPIDPGAPLNPFGIPAAPELTFHEVTGSEATSGTPRAHRPSSQAAPETQDVRPPPDPQAPLPDR